MSCSDKNSFTNRYFRLSGFNMPVILSCLLFVTFLFQVSQGWAINVEGLYSASVPVESRSSERDRQSAFSSALRQVLLKVTGQRKVLDVSAVRQAINSPQDLVESWSYNSTVDENGEQSLSLTVNFYTVRVQTLLEQSNFPFWPQNRPLTLIWVIEQGVDGRRQLMPASGSDDIISSVADTHGLPLLFPLMDLTDMQQVDRDRLWNLDHDHIQAISKRYDVESVLVLRLFSSLGDEYLGRSYFRFRDEEVITDLYGDNLAEILSEPVIEVAEHLSDYYGVLLSGTASRVPIEMQVDGIATMAQYAQLMRYLGSATDVSSVTLKRVSDKSVFLQLQTGGQIRQLVESIALDSRMEPVTDPTRAGETVSMHYSWQ